MTCPICEHEGGERLFEVPAPAGHATRTLVRCTGCSVVFVDPAPPAAVEEPASDTRIPPTAERILGRLRRARARRLAAGMVAGSALDVGCGQGRMLAALRDLGWKVAGVEISEEAARAARRRGIPVWIGPLESHGFADGEFDLVTFFRVLEHLRRPVDALREAHRILRPGGRLVIAVPNFGWLQQRLFGRRWMHLDVSRYPFYFDRRSLERLLEQTGFVPRQERHFSLEYSPLTWVQSFENLALGEGNLLYETLLSSPRAAASRVKRAVAVAGGVLLAPAAAAASAVAAATGNGDVIEVVATRR